MSVYSLSIHSGIRSPLQPRRAGYHLGYMRKGRRILVRAPKDVLYLDSLLQMLVKTTRKKPWSIGAFVARVICAIFNHARGLGVNEQRNFKNQ